MSGIWVGKGAARLGIASQAIGKDDSAFEALRLNQHPDGSGKLTPRNVSNSIRFFDFQCAPRKSASIMAGYVARSSNSTANGAVFVTACGDLRFIPDRFLTEAELSEQGPIGLAVLGAEDEIIRPATSTMQHV